MNVDYDPFEGWEVQGKPRFMLSRGETVYADGKVVSEPGRGRFVKRSLFEPALALMGCDFGVTVLPDPPYQRLVELIVKAESLGFDSGWTYDSPILWQEPYPLITLLADRTQTMRIGMCVTNPVTREPAVTASAHATLQDISGGRMVMGIGRGDSAVRVMGRKPTPIAMFEQRCAMIKDFMNGRPVDWEGTEIQLKWAQDKPEIPLYVAAYGPRALGVAGRVGGRRDHPARRPGDHRVDDGHGAARRPRRPGAIRPRCAAWCARRRRSPTTSPRRATRCAGSRRWSATTSPTSSACTARRPTSRAS